ncbi:acetyl-CoA C-acetyltransferase [Vibrio ruber]|uniref:acetyl-CoA C-acetyltransferase n=1 Tax=Vibrio ruber TaxID=184755 RepID=UPI0028932B25|nr:acetyl-CoA C-acetyltransferase [Vibrio ruber]WNJ97263.1 acetyl-CoA C-acetyltransferase [Vibrio ruber]
MKKVYIVASSRTPIGSFLGELKSVSAVELASITVKNNLKKANIEPNWVDEVICGTVLSAGQGMGPARQVALKSGIPVEKPAYTLNMICGSGMKCIAEGMSHILSGYSDVVIAVGMENMSQSPYLLKDKLRYGLKYGSFQAEDSIQMDGLTDSIYQIPMGETAETIAEQFQISREEQDHYSLNSHKKAFNATQTRVFSSEIAPVEVQGKSGKIVVKEDEHIRKDISLEQLGKLKPAFKSGGSITAGNSSGINDGASSVILASEEAVAKYNLKPLAEILAFGEGGVDPRVMGMGPVPAINNALFRCSLTIDDVDLVEINEAFAAQVLGVTRQLSQENNIEECNILKKLNINGGAIALGHPLGCSGNRIVVTLIHSMIRNDKEIGLASLCIGGGMGIAVVLKKI